MVCWLDARDERKASSGVEARRNSESFQSAGSLQWPPTARLLQKWRVYAADGSDSPTAVSIANTCAPPHCYLMSFRPAVFAAFASNVAVYSHCAS
jgi:hypothetical protein